MGTESKEGKTYLEVAHVLDNLLGVLGNHADVPSLVLNLFLGEALLHNLLGHLQLLLHHGRHLRRDESGGTDRGVVAVRAVGVGCGVTLGLVLLLFILVPVLLGLGSADGTGQRLVVHVGWDRIVIRPNGCSGVVSGGRAGELVVLELLDSVLVSRLGNIIRDISLVLDVDNLVHLGEEAALGAAQDGLLLVGAELGQLRLALVVARVLNTLVHHLSRDNLNLACRGGHLLLVDERRGGHLLGTRLDGGAVVVGAGGGNRRCDASDNRLVGGDSSDRAEDRLWGRVQGLGREGGGFILLFGRSDVARVDGRNQRLDLVLDGALVLGLDNGTGHVANIADVHERGALGRRIEGANGRHGLAVAHGLDSLMGSRLGRHHVLVIILPHGANRLDGGGLGLARMSGRTGNAVWDGNSGEKLGWLPKQNGAAGFAVDGWMGSRSEVVGEGDDMEEMRASRRL